MYPIPAPGQLLTTVLCWFFISVISERMQRQAAKAGEVYVSRFEAIANPALTSTATRNKLRRAEASRSSSRCITKRKHRSSSESDTNWTDLSQENLELLIQKEQKRVSRKEAHFLLESKHSSKHSKRSRRSRRDSEERTHKCSHKRHKTSKHYRESPVAPPTKGGKHTCEGK